MVCKADRVPGNPDYRRCELSSGDQALSALDSVPGSAPCYLSGPDGKKLKVTAEVVKAFIYLMETKKNGAVTITFRNGGVAGVKAEIVVK